MLRALKALKRSDLLALLLGWLSVIAISLPSFFKQLHFMGNRAAKNS